MSGRAVHVRFVASVQRRLCVWRSIDALLMAISIGVILTAIGFRFSKVAAVCGAMLALIALLWRTVRHWPTAAEAAGLMDAQFGWNELIQSARVASPHDDLRSAVAAIADARCAAANISALTLRPFGAGRVAVVAIALLIAAAIWVAPTGKNGARPELTPIDAATSLVDRPNTARAVAPGAVARSNVSNDPDEPSSRRGSAETITTSKSAATADSQRGDPSAGGGTGAAKDVAPPPAVAVTTGPKSSATIPGVTPADDGQGAMATAGAAGAGRGIVTPPDASGVSAWAGDKVDRKTTHRDSTASPMATPTRDADLIRAFFDR